ncbi:MAG: hypothetical protein MJ210_05185 [Alphaproteobacteria bacterium]|nr:hypothetical protein [Alphaproteobacteria bacterium]
MTELKRILSVLGICLALSSCGSLYGNHEEDLPRYREPRYTTEKPIELKSSKIDIVSEYTPTFERPNVEHLFPVSIEKTAKLWAQDRLKAADYSSKMLTEVLIKDASVIETEEKSEQLFEKDKVKYSAHLVATVRVTNPETFAQASTEVEAWRTLTIPADTDIVSKETYWDKMVENLFNDFNAKMTENIYKYLSPYIVNQKITPTYYE